MSLSGVIFAGAKKKRKYAKKANGNSRGLLRIRWKPYITRMPVVGSSNRPIPSPPGAYPSAFDLLLNGTEGSGLNISLASRSEVSETAVILEVSLGILYRNFL